MPVPDPPPHPPRLGINRFGYSGERVQATAILQGIRSMAQRHGFTEHAAAFGGHELVFLSRLGRPGPRFYLSAGIHGDEPAGLLALHDLIRDDAWPGHLNLGICPCLNPQGFERGTRENASGHDLNRDYRAPRSTEVRLHQQWLATQPVWDVSICLHEDWESHGFYLYELNPRDLPSLAGPILESVRRVCPIDASPWIDGRQATAPGLIRPTVDPTQRPDWPESFWLLQNGCGRGYTLEAPSDWPLPVRVRALQAAVQAALGHDLHHSRPAS
jgi:protein MpaA